MSVAAGEIVLAAANVAGPFGMELRAYFIICACRIPDTDQPYDSQVHQPRSLGMGEAFTALIDDHKRRIEATEGDRCRCLPDKAKFQKLRARYELT